MTELIDETNVQVEKITRDVWVDKGFRTTFLVFVRAKNKTEVKQRVRVVFEDGEGNRLDDGGKKVDSHLFEPKERAAWRADASIFEKVKPPVTAKIVHFNRDSNEKLGVSHEFEIPFTHEFGGKESSEVDARFKVRRQDAMKENTDVFERVDKEIEEHSKEIENLWKVVNSNTRKIDNLSGGGGKVDGSIKERLDKIEKRLDKRKKEHNLLERTFKFFFKRNGR